MKLINISTIILFLALETLASCNSFTSTLAATNPTVALETAMSTVKTAVIETQTATPLTTATTSPTLRATITPYKQPTLIPTIESAKIPDLLNRSLSIESLNSFNGYNLQRITGWSNGFNGGMWNRGSRNSDRGYLWMDSSHLLLFPATGEIQSIFWSTLTTRPTVININTGEIWLPPVDRAVEIDNRWFSIILPRWSPRLQVLVTGENMEQKEGVSTFTVDGERISHYEGQLEDISPSAEKVFINGDTWINLESGKKVNFGWGSGFGYLVHRWLPNWSRDENQIYFCCYYYGNAETGQSYTITNKDTIFDGKPFKFPNGPNLDHALGVWLNDHTVMAEYDAVYYGAPGFTAFFDVRERTYHNLGAVAGLPDQFNSGYPYYSISPNGDYMFMFAPTYPQVYLIDLATLKSEPYDTRQAEWSANGKYALLGNQVLTLSDKTLRTLPAQLDIQETSHRVANSWHPSEGVFVSIYANIQKQLIIGLLDVDNLTYREQKFDLPSNFNKTYYSNSAGIAWNPNGDRFAFVAADGSIWLLDYPKLEHLEQLTMPMENIKDISWSPDGRYLSYVGGLDIYFVDVDRQEKK